MKQNKLIFIHFQYIEISIDLMEFNYLLSYFSYFNPIFLTNFQVIFKAMKYWLSHLPLEVWVDVFVFPWITREELAQIVDRFRNHKFAEYLQFYLHDWGKRVLKSVALYERGLLKYGGWVQFEDIPQTPIPDNFKSFEYISINHFDAKIRNFLRHLGPILSAVNLNLYGINSPNDMENLRIIFATLLPMLDRIDSLAFDVCALPTMKQFFGEKLDKIKKLRMFDHGIDGMSEAALNFLLNWLTSPAQQDDNGPRCCHVFLSNELFKILSAIREQFLAAKTPSTFAVILHPNRLAWQQFVEFHLQNTMGEGLHGVKIGDDQVQITRHRANCGAELQEWAKENTKKRCGEIRICNPTIGSFDVIKDVPNVCENSVADLDNPNLSEWQKFFLGSPFPKPNVSAEHSARTKEMVERSFEAMMSKLI